jgi:S1-C subfamily serine protease
MCEDGDVGEDRRPSPPPPTADARAALAAGVRAASGRARAWVTYAVVAVLAASAGVGTTVAVHNVVSAGQGVGREAGAMVAAGPGGFAGHSDAMNDEAVYDEVVPGVVDVSSDLQYLEETAEGTGIVINAAAGLVLTNNHVIDGATSVTVTPVQSGRGYRATVLGYDRSQDVALIQVRGVPGLRAVPIGNSSHVTAGMAVLAIGNEAGQGGSPTVAPGVISSLDRTVEASDRSSGLSEILRGMLQTSADIRPGDSGGPLANAAGQVIGIDTAAGGSGLAAHVGYAIPINRALSIANRIAAGRASPAVHVGLPAFLGVLVPGSGSTNPVQQASQEQQRTGNVSSSSRNCITSDMGSYSAIPAETAPARSGALVDGVLCGTAAAAAGISAGDVITGLDGRAVTSPGSLTALLGGYRPGSQALLAWVSPDGVGHTAWVTLNAGPAG